MSPPRRRSSRLRGSKSNHPKLRVNPSRRLSSLMERDEDPIPTPQSSVEAPIISQTVPRTPATTSRIKPSFEEMHPGHAHSASSPSFDFHYASPAPKLGPDAQRMMDEVREEALRIKVRLAAERDEEKRNAAMNGSIENGGRRIATPRGKVGRFSDVHMAEFKKMDSIAGHASAFRAQPGRLAPAPLTLKRSHTKAQLDAPEEIPRDTKPRGHPENREPTTPIKRTRIGEVSSMPPNSVDKPKTPALSRSQSTLASLTTPTKSSMARAACVKQQSQIPTLARSPSKHSLAAPRSLGRSATMNNMAATGRADPPKTPDRHTGKLGFIKSLLRRPATASPEKLEPKRPVSTLYVKHTGIPNLDKELPSVPTTPTLTLKRSESVNRFNLTPKALPRLEVPNRNSPSPLKSGLPRSKSSMVNEVVNYPSLSTPATDGPASEEVNYPVLYPVPSVPQFSSPQRVSPQQPAVPGSFTFRSDKTISFGASPRGFGASPGQSSVRVVRPSIFPTAPGSFPQSNKENIREYPAIPHGISNKKRRRVDLENEEEDEVAEGSPAKKRKGAITACENLADQKIQAEMTAPKSKIPSPTKKGVLSLSRLNMLARPKVRK